MNDLALVLAASGLTYLLRIGFIVVLAGRALPPGFLRVVDLVKPAAFSALAVVGMVHFAGFGIPHLIAALVVIVGARLRFELLLNVAVGMVMMVLLSRII